MTNSFFVNDQWHLKKNEKKYKCNDLFTLDIKLKLSL